MTTDGIRLKIAELETLEVTMTGVEKRKREELAAIELQAAAIKKQINESLFTNASEYEELKELKTALKWIEA